MNSARLLVLAVALALGGDALAGGLALPGQYRWIVYASRQDPQEAIGLARRFGSDERPTQVLSSTNGWYAVVAGPVQVADPAALKKELAGSYTTPRDAFLSNGQGFVAQVWQTPKSPVLGRAALTQGSSRTAAAGGLDVVVEKKGKQEVAFVREGDKQVATVLFDAGASPTIAAAIVKLDSTSSPPQVVVTHFTGGAHCCVETKIAAKIGDRWQTLDAETLDGGGYGIVDLNGDGAAELLAYDNAFLYAFASYAESYAPPMIFRLTGKGLVDVSRDTEFRRPIKQMILAEEGLANQDGRWKSNGFLGGWVAEKALIGEGADAWAKMLQVYDRKSDWDLFECKISKPLSDCPEDQRRHVDFPTALKNLLGDRGYAIPGLVSAKFQPN
jgi:hypothetical protein